MNSRTGIVFLIIVMIGGCTPAPRYTSRQMPTQQKTETASIPVEKNPTLSYQKSWTGVASWYGEQFHGKLTANGETYDMHDFTAAHRTLPLGTVVRVTNLDNGKSVEVRVNDRGPYVKGRMIDLSYAAAVKLGYADKGTANVRLTVVKFGDNSYKKE